MRVKVANSSINSDKKRLELDRHADTNVLGKSSLMVHDFDRSVNVIGYYPDDGSKVCRNVTSVLDNDLN